MKVHWQLEKVKMELGPEQSFLCGNIVGMEQAIFKKMAAN